MISNHSLTRKGSGNLIPARSAASAISARTVSGEAIFGLPNASCIEIGAGPSDGFDDDAPRDLGSPEARVFSFRSSAWARASEKVVSSTLAPALARARRTARCSATMVLPVPAEPETRGGAGEIAGDQRGLRGMQEDRPFLPRLVERAAQARQRRQERESGGARRDGRTGSASTGSRFAAAGFSPTASFSSASCASGGRWAITSKSVSSLAVRTSSTHSSGTPKAINSNLRRLPNSFGFAARAGGSARLVTEQNFLDPLAHFDELHRPGRRMALDLAPLRPFVGGVVMADYRREAGSMQCGGR